MSQLASSVVQVAPGPGVNRLLRLVVALDAVASGALAVVVLAAVPVLVVWGTPTLVLVVGLLLIGYMVVLAALGAATAAILVVRSDPRSAPARLGRQRHDRVPARCNARATSVTRRAAAS